MATKVKLLHPYPVYEAHYETGEVIRLSFATPANKPINPEIGERLARSIYNGMVYERLNRDAMLKAAQAVQVEIDAVMGGEGTFDERYKKAAPLFTKRAALLDEYVTAEVAFRASYDAPLAFAKVSHPSIGTVDAETLKAKPKVTKSLTPAAILKQIKAIIAANPADGMKQIQALVAA